MAELFKTELDSKFVFDELIKTFQTFCVYNQEYSSLISLWYLSMFYACI